MDRETEEKILDAMMWVTNDYQILSLSSCLVYSLMQRFEEELTRHRQTHGVLRYFGRRLSASQWTGAGPRNLSGTGYIDPQVNELWQLYMAGFTNGAAALMLAPTPRGE